MRKKIFLSLMLLFAGFGGAAPENKAEAATTTPVVYWDGMQLLKGQVGRVDILKPVNLWKRNSENKLEFVRVLKAGERYRVYQYSSMYGGQYGVGGPYFVTNVKGYVQYFTPSLMKLRQVNPEAYGTKLSIGTVTSEQAKVIAPGVVQSQFAVDSSTEKQTIYKLDVDQKASQIALETSLSKDQMIGFETVKSMANRQSEDGHYVIAAINGDYFDEKGAPIDMTVRNGELVTTSKTPISERAIFGVTPEGKALMGNPDLKIEMKINGEKPYTINSVNKRRFGDHLVLYTPYFAATTATNELGTEVVLSNITGKLNGTNTVTATVKEVQLAKGDAALNDGELVLSGHGLGSEYLKALKAGDKVDLNLTYDTPAWSNVEQAIGGRYPLVKAGITQTFSIPGAHPRSAIGIKADGSVFVVVVDGRQESASGVTLTELAKVMKDFGAVNAMTFDGGGSSTMVVRQPGDYENTVINSPSDGRERSVANALLIVGKWNAGPVQTLLLDNKEITVFAGATYMNLNITGRGLDKMNNPVELTEPLTFTSTAGVFNADGSFKAMNKTGSGLLTAMYGTAKANVTVKVTSSLDSIKLPSETMMVEKNGTLPLKTEGYLAGKKVVEDPSVFTYTVSGNIGKVENGVFKAGAVDGTGEIIISYRTVSTKMKVIVGNPGTLLIDGFEGSLSDWTATGARYNTVSVAAERNYVKSGSQSLKVAYDFTGTTGISGVYAAKSKPLEIFGTPKKIGMWVYGDAKGHWLRSQLKDAVGTEIQLDFTKNLDWTGWKYVEADIPTGLKAPYKLELPVRYMEVLDTNKNKGQIFVDDLKAIY